MILHSYLLIFISPFSTDHLFYSGTGADPLRGSTHTDPRSLAGGGGNDASIRKYYIDPLTGEMKYLSRNVQQQHPDIVYYHPSAQQDVAYDLVRR